MSWAGPEFSCLTSTGSFTLLFERGHVYDKAVFHIALQKAIIGIIDLVDADYFEEFYRAISPNEGDAVALLRRDGALLVRHPNVDSAVGEPMPVQSPWYASIAQGGGTYRTPGHVGGIPRIINLLCDMALVYGYADQKPKIDADTVNEMLEDKAREGGWLFSRPRQRRASHSQGGD